MRYSYYLYSHRIIRHQRYKFTLRVVLNPQTNISCHFRSSLKMVFGAISDEMEVKAPAAEVWKVYSTLQLAKLVVQMRPDLVEKFEVVEGDGGVGTILKLTFPATTPVFTSSKEKFTVIDDEKRVKETEVVEGGYLNLGFTLYRVRFEIIEKDETTCITKSTVEYEVKEESAGNASFVSIQPFVGIMNAAATNLTTKQM